MEDEYCVVVDAMTWLGAGFIKGASVQRLLCATETLVCVLIGSATGTRCIDCCVFFLVCCVVVVGPRRLLMMFAE